MVVARQLALVNGGCISDLVAVVRADDVHVLCVRGFADADKLPQLRFAVGRSVISARGQLSAAKNRWAKSQFEVIAPARRHQGPLVGSTAV